MLATAKLEGVGGYFNLPKSNCMATSVTNVSKPGRAAHCLSRILAHSSHTHCSFRSIAFVFDRGTAPSCCFSYGSDKEMFSRLLGTCCKYVMVFITIPYICTPVYACVCVVIQEERFRETFDICLSRLRSTTGWLAGYSISQLASVACACWSYHVEPSVRPQSCKEMQY